ncbi:MAG: RNA polymerase sigma factor [Xanthomonadales bacterium]|nr:RNA polymerase sigma factor [Xanthomonadales bacterium]
MAFLDHRDGLQAMVCARLGDLQDVHDILQDTWLRLSAVKAPEDVDNPSAYVYRTTSNVMVDHLRRAGRWCRYVLATDELLDNVAAPQPSPEAVADHRQRLRQMRSLLAELSPKCQRAFLLSRCEGLSYRAIGHRLGISDNMVKKYLIQALAHLRTQMPPSGERGEP